MMASLKQRSAFWNTPSLDWEVTTAIAESTPAGRSVELQKTSLWPSLISHFVVVQVPSPSGTKRKSEPAPFQVVAAASTNARAGMWSMPFALTR